MSLKQVVLFFFKLLSASYICYVTLLIFYHVKQILFRLSREGSEKVLAFSLFGSEERYTDGVLANAKLYRHIYPDWSMRVYYNRSVPQAVLQQLTRHGVELVQVANVHMNPTLWRFQAALDKRVLYFCSRDADSRLSVRESSAVYEWLRFNRDVHIMVDHPGHLGVYTILAGMWCAKASAVRPYIQPLLGDARVGNFDPRAGEPHFFTDQTLLLEYVVPLIGKSLSLLRHRSFGCKEFDDIDSYSFPLPRVGLEHVGAVYIDGFLRERDARQLKEAIVRREQCE
jgi:hypothetical protein